MMRYPYLVSVIGALVLLGACKKSGSKSKTPTDAVRNCLPHDADFSTKYGYLVGYKNLPSANKGSCFLYLKGELYPIVMSIAKEDGSCSFSYEQKKFDFTADNSRTQAQLRMDGTDIPLNCFDCDVLSICY